jgi:predicted Rossmann-fold nucleotide-binding protein
MGGHAVPRGSAPYRLAATLGWELARADQLVVTGGGPGVMEAANLGAYLATRPAGDLTAAIDELAAAPDFLDHDPYTAAALAVRARFAPAEPAAGDRQAWSRRGGLAIPTWLYGHEPANLFAGRVAKYFSNAIREDGILARSNGGIVVLSGAAGTVQEIFQAVTPLYYAPDHEPLPPLVLVGRRHWTEIVPVWPALLRLAAGRRMAGALHLVDELDDVLACLSHPVG